MAEAMFFFTKRELTVIMTSIQTCQSLSLLGSCNTLFQGRNMVYPGPTDPYFLAVILIPEPHFPQNFDP